LSLSVLYLLAPPSVPQEALDEVAERIAAGEQLSCTEVGRVIAEAKNNSTAENDGHADDQDRVGGEEETGDVSSLDTRTDARGRRQPGRRPKKSRFKVDVERHAGVIGHWFQVLVELLDESPERFDAMLDHLRNDADVIDTLAALARNPKARALIAVAVDAAPEVAAEPNQAPAIGNTTTDIFLPADGDIPPFLDRRAQLTATDKEAIAEIESSEAARTRLKTANRIARLKAKQSGALGKMPAQGKDTLALIHTNEVVA
jgi:hypothetical protein